MPNSKLRRSQGHAYYTWAPLTCSIAWLITLLVLILTWAGQGRPHYISEDGTIPYISDIAADVLKPFFIVGCIFTALTFVATLIAARWLRHRGRLTPDFRTRQKVWAILAILGACIGGTGLILLSILDTKHFTKLHRVFLGIFMLGVALSAIFTVSEHFSLTRQHRNNAGLRISAMAKGVVATILIALAVAMGVCLGTDRNNAGAILEWLIAFGFALYPMTFWLDLRKARSQWALDRGTPETGEAR